MPIKFPASSDELRNGGYDYDGDSHCKGCGAEIEWWITPNGKRMPMSVQKAGNPLFTTAEVRVPHFSNCPNAKDFRK